jgi:diaminopimelate decarboxylase
MSLIPEIYYPVKANSFTPVLEAILNLRVGFLISHLSELEYLKKFNACDILVSAPSVEPYLLKKAFEHKIRYISVNSRYSFDTNLEILKAKKNKIKILLRISASKNSPQKFGNSRNDINALIRNCPSNINIAGLHIHVGTNILGHIRWAEKMYFAQSKFADMKIKDFGGGFPAPSLLLENGYDLSNYIEAMLPIVSLNKRIILEPGRYLVEDAFYCITKVLEIKGNKIYLDVASNSLPPLDNNNYSVIGILSTRNCLVICKRIGSGRGYYLIDRGCMNNLYLPKLSIDYAPSVGDFVIIGRCGAYTYSLWSSFGASIPDILIIPNFMDKLERGIVRK